MTIAAQWLAALSISERCRAPITLNQCRIDIYFPYGKSSTRPLAALVGSSGYFGQTLNGIASPLIVCPAPNLYQGKRTHMILLNIGACHHQRGRIGTVRRSGNTWVQVTASLMVFAFQRVQLETRTRRVRSSSSHYALYPLVVQKSFPLMATALSCVSPCCCCCYSTIGEKKKLGLDIHRTPISATAGRRSIRRK